MRQLHSTVSDLLGAHRVGVRRKRDRWFGGERGSCYSHCQSMRHPIGRLPAMQRTVNKQRREKDNDRSTSTKM